MSRSGIGRAAAVVAVLMGTLTGVSAAAQEEDTGPGNRALIDTEATAEALDAAKSLSEDLFSFTHTDLKAHEAKFARLTTGDFTRDYGTLFHTVITRAQTDKLTLTSVVVESGVLVLHEDSAEVLVFLDQSSRSATTNQETASHAMFRASIQRVDGDWKFAGIDLYEGS